MNAGSKFLRFASKGFVVLSVLSLLYVSILAIFDPQSVMDLVGVKLPNTDSISSIRGVYGGVGVTIVALLIRYLLTDVVSALRFLSIFWGAYAISRLITMISDGPLGAFGMQWLMIESVFCLIAIVLLLQNKKLHRRPAQL
ncbi:DUF4345 domain-containing protein [Pseudoflavitalea sp. G-6-1-2]|uniref:DUF4345 domain-containing protein n=1 Tax=Pseudoflavitalea sp. G-6-1-2 TaxID=2728841 RepID=UPI00146B7098|nr:DUF4345 domain-containing protein [Pseudoflavitalea sp. G-6-1-2]NML21120.1 DUF4345 domain-containing protein [Pseudoflavitalea sp. G-6-1-2]